MYAVNNYVSLCNFNKKVLKGLNIIREMLLEYVNKPYVSLLDHLYGFIHETFVKTRANYSKTDLPENFPKDLQCNVLVECLC